MYDPDEPLGMQKQKKARKLITYNHLKYFVIKPKS